MSPLNDPREALRRALQYDAGDPKRIQHLIKVYAFAEMPMGSICTTRSGAYCLQLLHFMILVFTMLSCITVPLPVNIKSWRVRRWYANCLQTGQRILWKKFVIWWPDTIPTPVWTD